MHSIFVNNSIFDNNYSIIECLSIDIILVYEKNFARFVTENTILDNSNKVE